MEPKTTKTNSHYKWLLLLQLLFAVAIFTSCDQGKEKRQHDLDDFKAFVQHHKDSMEYYADRKWDELNAEFEQKKAELDKQTDKMDEQVRESYNASIEDWNNFKVEHTRKAQENSKVAQMDRLRATLVIDGIRQDYTDLTAKDLVREYEHFVNTVKANKDTYTQEQWTVINVNYKALNGRKRELEKNIASGDGGKITKLQLEYTGIKAVNRPFADAP